MLCSDLSGAGKGCSSGSSALQQLSEAHAPRLGTASSTQTPDKAIPNGKVLLGEAGAQAVPGCAGLCPHRAEGLCPAPPRRLLAPHGALRGRAGRRAGPAVITLPAPWGHRGAPSRDRASLRAVRRAPSALLHNRRQRRGYTTNGGAAPARPRYRRREGTGPRLSPSAGLTPPPWRPLPRGHLRYLRRVRHPGAAGEQLPFLPFPP